MDKAVKKICSVILVVVILSVTSGCATYQVHPEFKERQKKIHSISVMSPGIDAYVLTFQGDKKRLDDVADIMKTALVEEIEKIFAEKGYDIRKLDLSEEKLNANSDLKTAVFNINRLLDKSLSDIKQFKQPKFTYSLGSDVNTFGDISKSDVLIFVRGEGIELSTGEMAKEVTKALVLGVAAAFTGIMIMPCVAAGAYVQVVIVDATDGAILWYNDNLYAKNGGTQYYPRNKDSIKRLIKSLICAFPDDVRKSTATKGNELGVPQGGLKTTKDVAVSPAVVSAH